MRCAWCGDDLQPAATGRRRRTCSAACRQNLRRDRLAPPGPGWTALEFAEHFGCPPARVIFLFTDLNPVEGLPPVERKNRRYRFTGSVGLCYGVNSLHPGPDAVPLTDAELAELQPKRGVRRQKLQEAAA